jgi:two-component sensor histidine kinase
MSVLYDKLYRSDGAKEMPLDEYLSPLIDKLIAMFPIQPYVRIIKQIEPIVLNAKVLFSLGIIVNELLTNALKYAFAPGESGTIQIVTSVQGNYITVSVIDSGGKYAERQDVSTTGFGLQVVQLMAKQIGAQFDIYTSGHEKSETIARISFYKG